ncbi:MAG: hypothetical protein AB7V32_10205 [Candidatus Berkiella sp.]
MQTILEYAGTQLEAWEAEAQLKYPNAFKSDTGSEPSSAPSSSPSSPALSPRASAHGLPPPPPAMPSPDYFKPLPKSEKEVELSKYRREKAYRIEELKRHLKENCDMDLSNEMIAHLGDHIDQWEALRAHFDEFSSTRVAYRKALEGVDDKESLVSSAMMLHEYKERLEALSESIQGAMDEINKILSQSDRESNVNSVKIERIKLLLFAYEKKLELISKSLDNDFTENDKAALNLTDIVEQRDNIRRDIGALSSLITIISTKEQPSLNLAAQSNDFDLVKTLALKTTNLGARDNDGKTFLNYLNPSQVQELSAYLLENGAAKNALKVALLQQDINLVKKISTEFKINLFDINSNDDPIWNYLPSTLSDESTFSKMSYFFSTHETFNHWLNQTLKDKMNSLHAQFHPTFAKLDVELMEINETLIGIRELSMPIERYIEQANEKCKEIQATLEAFEAKHASLLHPNYEHLNEVSGKYKALKEVLSNLHQSLTDVQTNSQDRLKEEAESKKRPKSN